MKLAIAWFTILALCIAVSCSVNHRSGDYACTKQTDCPTPRVCEDGFCVVPDGVPIDAPPGPPTDGRMPMVDGKVTPDAQNGCPAQCTSCDLGSHKCLIECGACTNEVVCPAGFSCTIGCNNANACRNGVICTDATACTVVCGGANSCKNIMCGDGPCDVTCSGPGSCHGVDCGPSCACDVSCTGSSSGSGGPPCQNVICSGIACTDGLGCSSANPQCDTCP